MYMKNIILLLIFNFISFNCSSQNLVPNPSFEQYDTELYLPEYTMQGEMTYTALFWKNSYNTPKYVSPHNDTVYTYYGFTQMSDYMSEYNGLYLPSNTGDHYALLENYTYQTNGDIYEQTREFTCSPLVESLVAGEEYCLSFYVKFGPGCTAAIDQLGMLLTHEEMLGGDSFYDPFYWAPCAWNEMKDFSPQLETPVGTLFDNDYWVKVVGSFVAEGGEQYVTLGCFVNDDELTYEFDDLCSTMINDLDVATGIYMYDDVSVYKCDEPTYPANAGADICLKEGQSLQLGTSDLEDYFYEWSVSGEVISTEGMPWVSPDTTTIYGLHQKDFAFNETWDEISVVIIVGDEECILSIEDKLLSEINFYPNPSTGIYKIESPYLMESLELYNLLGELINMTTIHSLEYELNIQNQADGIYFVKMKIGEETVWKKLIKESRY